jgi:hypothetical protein
MMTGGCGNSWGVGGPDTLHRGPTWGRTHAHTGQVGLWEARMGPPCLPLSQLAGTLSPLRIVMYVLCCGTRMATFFLRI